MAVVAAAVLAGLGWVVLVAARPDRGMELLVKKHGARVEVVDNATAAATLDDVRAWPASAWKPWTETGYLKVAHGDVIWMRVTLNNPGAEPLAGVLADTSYFADRVEVWTEHADGWRRQVSGCAVHGADKPLWTRQAAFPVWVPADGERTVYLRTSDAYLAHIQPVWWESTEVFFGAKTRHALVQCVCFGALLGLMLYNAVLWLRLRFEDTGYYVLTAAAGVACNYVANGGFALTGFAVGSPWLETLVAATMAAGAAAMTKFTRVFLGTRELMPRADRWLRGWQFAAAVLAGLTPVMLGMPGPQGVNVAALTAVLTDLFCVIAAVFAWRRGARHARFFFFLAAFGFLALAGLPLIASVVRSDVNAGVAMGVLIGRTLEMLLLSFAVADRFAATQRKLVDETEQRRAIEEAYSDELEVEVRERTRELAEANADKDRMIAVIGHDLRSPLTALTRTAEHVGAGEPRETPQGRFIADAAQTGRQVLLLIEDLVLWARLRAGTTHKAAVAVADLVAPVMALYRPQAERNAVELGAADVPGDLRVTTDLVLAQTLLRNLTANALRYARTRVRIAAEAVPAGVRVTVRDDGPGLPDEVAARLASEVAARDWAGQGLGLRLCMEISRALGAGLVAKTAGGGGTEFTFVLEAGPDDERKVTRL